MEFNSIPFALFFVCTLAVHAILPDKLRWLWLLITGIFFYAYAQPAYTLVPLFITVISFYAGLRIEAAAGEKKKQQLFVISTVLIVLVLVFFKYVNFFSNTFTDIFSLLTGRPGQNSLLLNIIAPLGISYITFQAIGYLVEIKRGDEPAEKHFGHFAAYIFLFTKIIAGPVEKAHRFLPQLQSKSGFNYDNFVSGAQQLLWGLFKKLVIADRLSIYVNAVYNNHEHHSGITLLFASICFTFQLYTDFSGYTDMALGLSRMLGYELTQNFNRPLLSKSVSEFWRKWHITLSAWFTDYFYNPLAIAKRNWGQWAVIFASFVTFTVLGFWHGANWTFIIFGFLQGLILAIEILTKKKRKNIRQRIPKWLNDSAGIAFTFLFFTFSSIFFKADTVGEALSIIKKFGSIKGPFFYDSASMFMLMLMGIFYIVAYDVKKEFFDNRFSITGSKYWLVRNGYYCALIVIILATGVFDGGEFIYFQF